MTALRMGCGSPPSAAGEARRRQSREPSQHTPPRIHRTNTQFTVGWSVYHARRIRAGKIAQALNGICEYYNRDAWSGPRQSVPRIGSWRSTVLTRQRQRRSVEACLELGKAQQQQGTHLSA